MNYEKAIKKAKEVFAKYNYDFRIPFPFERIVNSEESIEGVYYTDLTKFDNEGKMCSGLIWLKESEGKDIITIYISDRDSKQRQYFTIAHELGHYFLHRDKLKENIITIDDVDTMKAMLRNGMMSSEEVEANYFAAELIMPEEQVREMYDKLNGDIDDLASFFRVSKLAMAIRVDTLNLEK